MMQSLISSHGQRRVSTFSALMLIALVIGWAGMSMGAAEIDPLLPWWLLQTFISDFVEPTVTQNIALNIRLPRVLMALMVGATLAISGASLQGVCRNPLADPGLLGISSGAAVGAVSVILFAKHLPFPPVLSPYLVSFAAFVGAAAATFTIYRLAQSNGVLQIPTMLLAGVAINALGAAIIGGLSFIADDQTLRLITFWMMGSLASATWNTVSILTPVMAFVLWAIYQRRHDINLILLGEANALYSGVDVNRVKNQLLWLNALAVGVAVSFSGIIAFVGLVVPHILRVHSDTNYRYLLINSALLGAALLTLADLASRMVLAPAELPIGILTSLIGAPFFMFLLMQQKHRQSFGI